MPTLQDLHEHAVEQAIEADPRDRDQIERALEDVKEEYESLEGARKEQFDEDRLENPFDDSKVLYGGDRDVSTVAVGIDLNVQDLVLVERLNEQGAGIDAAITHHPSGRAYANLHRVMKLQVDAMHRAGIPVSQAEGVALDSLKDVKKRIHPRNHPRDVQAAQRLDLPFACMHTVTDNLAYRHVKEFLAEEAPRTLADLLDALLELEEYRWALGHGVAPEIFAGSEDSRVGELGVLGFTGGTDPGEELIATMVDAGIDTLVAMHATPDQIQKAEEHHVNIVSAGHMASDSLGFNLVLDALQDAYDFSVEAMSGFTRVKR